jgi:hypothetical protein
MLDQKYGRQREGKEGKDLKGKTAEPASVGMADLYLTIGCCFYLKAVPSEVY